MATLSTNYIASALKRGEQEEFIRRSLRMQGISEEDINRAFEEVKGGGGNNFQDGENNFLESNISPQFSPADTRVNVNIQRAPIYAQPKLNESRLQYAPQKSYKTFLLVILMIVLIVSGVAGYLYFDRIYSFVFKPKAESFGEDIKTSKIVPLSTQQDPLELLTVAVSTTTATATASEIFEEPAPPAEEPELVKEEDLNLAKIDAIKQGQLFLAEQFKTNGVYPVSYVITGDPGAFYCYRKNGAHYVLGVVLDISITSAQKILAEDLDGDYYCGNTIKKCADPVYCVGP